MPAPAAPPAPSAPPYRGGQGAIIANNASANAAGINNDFCSVRIRALLGATNSQADNKTVLVQPTVCSIYASKENPLIIQPGIPELGHLYDDIYDGETGKFSGRSIAMQSLYDSDLKKLYFAFTGDSDMPDSIKTFGDINILALTTRYTECGPVIQTAKQAPVKREDPLGYRDQNGYYRDMDRERREKLERDKERAIQDSANNEKYYKSERENYSGIFTTQFKVAKNSGAYINYGAHIKQMIINADRARANLMQVVDKLFLVVESTSTTSESAKKTPIITIHPNLTYAMLDTLINQTREMRINLYVGCERDFYTGLSLLHVIIEEIMNANMNARLDALKSDTRKAIEKLSQDAVRANARNGVVKSNYDTSDPALLSSSQLRNFVESEENAPPKTFVAEFSKDDDPNVAGYNSTAPNPRPILKPSAVDAVPESESVPDSVPAAATAATTATTATAAEGAGAGAGAGAEGAATAATAATATATAAKVDRPNKGVRFNG